MVSTMKIIRARRSPVAAACTASAIVRLLPMRTRVLTDPSVMSRVRLASPNTSGYQTR